MDYIIIALWGLIAGGLLWGGGNKNAQPRQTIDQKYEAEYSDLIERPSQNVSKPKVILGNDLNEVTTITPEAYSSEDIAIVDNLFDEPASVNSTVQTEIRSIEPAPVQVPDEPVVATKEPATEHSAIAFNRQNKKVGPVEAKPKRKAIKFKKSKTENTENVVAEPVVEVATPVQRDTIVIYTIDGNVVDESTANALVEEYGIADPVIQDSTVQVQQTSTSGTSTNVNKRTDVKLPKGLSIKQLLCDEKGMPKVHKLQRGETLTQIAHKYYADACFWPYIFEVNMHKLKSPDKLQADMKLYLPDPEYYGINGNNPASVSRAKTRATKYK